MKITPYHHSLLTTPTGETKMFKKVMFALMITLLVLINSPLFAQNLPIDLEKCTPVGSWMEKESIRIDEKGKTTLFHSKMSIVGEEKCGEASCIWLEVINQEMKADAGGKQSPTGKKSIIKVLMEKSVFKQAGVNALNNFSKLAKMIIMKNGTDKAMKFSPASNPMMASMLQSMDMKSDIAFTPQGDEKITVPAGSFTAKKFTGQGKVTVQVFNKAVQNDSKSTMWVNEDVPFGLIKSHLESIREGKTTVHDDVLLSSGKTGAVSEITEQVEEMPGFPGVPGKTAGQP
jgi:hypothetical protein